MAIWSHRPLGNDVATGWLLGLEEYDDFSLVEDAIQQVLDLGDDYVDADLAAEAVAAAEVLAQAMNRGTEFDKYAEPVEEWLRTIEARPTPGQLCKARAALVRILARDSELREYWERQGDAAEWECSVRSLFSALGS